MLAAASGSATFSVTSESGRASVRVVRRVHWVWPLAAALTITVAGGATASSQARRSDAGPAAVEIGGVALGVLGDPGRFRALTGQVSTTRLMIASWSQTNFAQLFAMMGPRPMLGINPESLISPGQIARG